ncbi:MAG: hypothetical protein D3914_14920 [Candidatus Electrothrix sp. LOE2]|nr:hypothetical protein [Candidatus Electrothrix sp. LOE2]
MTRIRPRAVAPRTGRKDEFLKKERKRKYPAVASRTIQSRRTASVGSVSGEKSRSLAGRWS